MEKSAPPEVVTGGNLPHLRYLQGEMYRNSGSFRGKSFPPQVVLGGNLPQLR